MEEQKYIWMNGKLIPWGDAKVHVLAHSLHYGDGAFEGIRVYKTDRGPAVFRLREHIDRLLYSSGVIDIAIPYSAQALCDATCELLREINLEAGYVRPLAIHGYGVMGVNSANCPVDVIIAAWPWGKYIGATAADIKVSKYIRIHPRSTVPDAKLSGHYVNSLLAVLELRGTKYHEALFLDDAGNIAEGPGENFFMVKDGILITPPLGAILAGITRQSVMEIALSLGYQVQERTIPLADAYTADEAFFTGTAAEVTPIASIDDQPLGTGTEGPVTHRLRTAFLDVVHGKNKDFEQYLTFVKE